MITKRDKKENWEQTNYRLPRIYRSAIKKLANDTGIDIEEIVAEAVGYFLDKQPLDIEQLKCLRAEIKKGQY
jgi:hypothetical protein